MKMVAAIPVAFLLGLFGGAVLASQVKDTETWVATIAFVVAGALYSTAVVMLATAEKLEQRLDELKASGGGG